VSGERNQSAACIPHPSVASSRQTWTALLQNRTGSGADRSHVDTRSRVLSEGPLSTTTNSAFAVGHRSFVSEIDERHRCSASTRLRVQTIIVTSVMSMLVDLQVSSFGREGR